MDGADPELGRLLDHKAGAGRLERREQQPQIGRRRLLRGPRGEANGGAVGRDGLDGARPLPIAPVEEANPVARRLAHHVAEVMGLAGCQRDRGARFERGLDVEPDRAPAVITLPLRSVHGRLSACHCQNATIHQAAMVERLDNGASAPSGPGPGSIERAMPPFARPFVALARLDQPVGVWLLLWPCLWAIGLASEGLPDLELLVLFTAGAFVMRAAGCTLNDIFDRDFDARVERTRRRPLPSGAIGVKGAVAFMAVLLGAASPSCSSSTCSRFCLEWARSCW